MARWMIIEPDDDTRAVYRVMLQIWGETMMEYKSMWDAWNFFEQIEEGNIPPEQYPDLLITEIFRGDVLQLVTYMRTIPAVRHIPILLITLSMLNESWQDRGRNAGIDHLIFKPFPDFDKFYGIIQGVIAKRVEINHALGWIPDISDPQG